MRVSLVIDGLPIGGAQTQAIATVSALRAHGVEAELVTYGVRNDHSESLARLGVPLTVIPRRLPIRARRLFNLTQHLARFQPDVVHAFKEPASVWGRLAARLARVRCVFGGCRGQESPGRALDQLNAQLTRGTAGWIVNSQASRSAALRRFACDPRLIHVAPNVLLPATYQASCTRDAARRALGLSDGDFVVLHAASLTPVKNHALLLRAARLLPEQTVILLAGAGPEEASIRGQIAPTGARVRLLGNRTDMPQLLRAADAAVLTSRREGLPNALLEAQAAGLPVVATRCGGAEEVVEHERSGLLVPGDAHADLANALVRLASDPALRAAFGEHGRERVLQTHSPAVAVRSLIDVYEAGLARRSS